MRPHHGGHSEETFSWQFCSLAASQFSAPPMPPTDAALVAITLPTADAPSMAGLLAQLTKHALPVLGPAARATRYELAIRGLL
jgi:hypothetical protein